MDEQPITILHVEDNPDHAHLVERSLRSHSPRNRVYLVEDGEAALDYLFRRRKFRDPTVSPWPDIILLDLRLPKVDGLEVLRTIKTTEEMLSIPVVILSSSDAEGDLATAYRYQANSYLVKPVDFGKFVEMMHHLSTYWLAWNQYAKRNPSVDATSTCS